MSGGSYSGVIFRGKCPGVTVLGESSLEAIVQGDSCPGRGDVWIPLIITQCFLKITCLIYLHSQFKFVSKLILYSARGGRIMIISTLQFFLQANSIRQVK